MYKYPNSILATTNEDSHGERFSREQLQLLVDACSGRMPLNVEHDLGKPSVAHIENLRLEKHGDEYRVVGDITSETPLEPMRGLSISATSIMYEPEQGIVHCYLPYPAYKDPGIIGMLKAEGDVVIGRLQRKGLTGTEVGLIAAVLAVLVGPEWDIQYRQRVRPQICRALSLIKSKLSGHRVDADLTQKLRIQDRDVSLVLIPDRTSLTSGQDIHAIDKAIDRAVIFIQQHERRDIRRLRSVYYPNKGRYEIINVEYTDGCDLNIVP